jgi:hypothetical protein
MADRRTDAEMKLRSPAAIVNHYVPLQTRTDRHCNGLRSSLVLRHHRCYCLCHWHSFERISLSREEVPRGACVAQNKMLLFLSTVSEIFASHAHYESSGAFLCALSDQELGYCGECSLKSNATFGCSQSQHCCPIERSRGPQRLVSSSGENNIRMGASNNNVAWLLSSGTLFSWLQTLSLEIANSANAYTLPNQSGKSGGVSYTFSNFAFDSNLGTSISMTESGPEQVTVVWNGYDFVLLFNYHVCDIVCESGWVEIFTTQVVPVSVDIALDFSGVNVVTTPLSALLANQQTAKFIEIYVQCTNTFCLIPTSKIAQAIANGFLAAFDGGVMQAIASVAQAHPMSTTFTVPLGATSLRAALAGLWTLTPNTNLLIRSVSAPCQCRVRARARASHIRSVPVAQSAHHRRGRRLLAIRCRVSSHRLRGFRHRPRRLLLCSASRRCEARCGRCGG